jgi:hypothetical protein
MFNVNFITLDHFPISIISNKRHYKQMNGEQKS